MSKRAQLFGKTLFVDLMMSTLVVVTALLIASNAVEKEQRQQVEDANLKTDGKYAITAEWPDKSADDVDLYVRDPTGTIAYYDSRDVGLMHLEHDDQGTASDTAPMSSVTVKVERNEERTIIRGAVPGEYTVNVHMFNKRDVTPTAVVVRLVRLTGEDTAIVKKEIVFTQKGEERTAFRFTLDAGGTMTGTNEWQRQLVGRGRGGNQ